VTPDRIRELVVMSYKAYDAGNRDFIVDLFDDDISWTFYSAPQAIPFPNRLRGKAEVLAALKATDDVVQLLKNEVERLVVEGDTAALILDQTLKHRATGRILRHKLAAFQTYRRGRLVEYVAFADGIDRLQQALGRELDLPDAYPR
jgi:ketosteroid isomerase-like protein